MHSCEYSDVQGEQRTKILCIRNIRFFDDNNRDISKDFYKIHLAVSVTLTFEFQKRDIQNDIIWHQRSNDTKGGVNYVRSGEGFYTIPSSIFLQRIRFVVDILGESRLGFKSSEVGTHSNRSGGAMGMLLAGTPIYTIIRKQVLQLSHGISSRMLTYNEFYTVPAFVHSHADGGLHCRGGVTLAASTNLHGSHANMSRGMHPAFHLNQ
jgi:hypothetical protein